MARINIVNADNKIESNPRRAYFKLKNTGGPKGDTGAQGPQGPKGDTGAQGPAGLSASVTVGSTTTLAPGASATVTNTGDTRNAVLNFGIPTGAQGPQGVQGPKGDTGPEGAKGAKGDTGAAATVTVANTNTGAPGTNASVENVGDEHNAVLNFTIPRGDKGETGAQGPEGPAGQDGKDFTPTVVTALPETGENGVLYMTEKSHTTQTATGNPITATITDGAGKMEAFQLDGDTFQQSYTGKNLFNVQGDYVVGLINGNTGVITEDSTDTTVTTGIGSIKVVNSHPSGNFRGYISGKIVLQAGSYTLNFTRVETTGHYVAVFTYDSDDNFLGRVITLSGQVTSGNGDISNQVAYVRIVFETNTHGTTVTFNDIQLEAGSTATDYEPYVGGIPSPNPDYPQAIQTVTGEQTVAITGKNLFNKNNPAQILDGAFINAGTKVIGASDGFATVWIECEPNTTYAISKAITSRFSIATTTSTPAPGVGTSGVSPHPSNTQYVYTTAADARYLVIMVRSSSDTLTTAQIAASIQIELGSTATAYAPYSKQTFSLDLGSIELCKLGTYQDRIYKDGDDWKVEKKTWNVTIDGTMGHGSYSNTSTNTARLAFSPLSPTALPQSSDVSISDKLTRKFMWSTDEQGFYLNNQTAVMRVNKTIVGNTEDSFITWLGSNPINIYYAASTATTTTITDAGLIAQLEAIRTALLENGANTIMNTATSPNLAGDMEIGYYGYTPSSQYDKWLWLDVGAAGAHYEQI